MPTTDPRVDAYIKSAQPFAQPILRRLRRVIHTACPDVVEGMKWKFPHFDYKGMFCGVAAFKAHATFGFWKYQILIDRGLLTADDGAHGQFGQLKSVEDLPADKELIALIKAAAKLNDDGVKVAKPKRAPRLELKPPAYLVSALKKHPKAQAAFRAFSPSHRREYIEWITEAKTEPTRIKRLNTALEWIASGKGRNWQYEK